MTKIAFAMLAMMLTFTSCDPEDGIDGINGIDGIDGKNGEQGIPGQNGNANVNVDVFELKSTDWQWNSFYGFSTSPSSFTEYYTRFYDRNIPSLTEDFITKEGIVLVYMQNSPLSNPLSYTPLPFVIPNADQEYEYHYRYEIKKGKLRLHFFLSALRNNAVLPQLSTYNMPTAKFKVVVLTGTMKMDLTAAKIDINNLEAVHKFLKSADKNK